MAERCSELHPAPAAVNITKLESQPPMGNLQVRNGDSDNTHNISPISIPLPHITKLLLQSESIGAIQQSELQKKTQHNIQQWSDMLANLPPLHELVSPSWLSDTEKMRTLRESVAALRMWVLCQPVVLGHPTGPSNPTFLQVCRGGTDSSTFPSAFLDQTFINLSWGLDPPPMFIKARQYHADDEEEDLDLTDLTKYKMEQLRKYCRRNEVNVKSTRKQDLIDAILAHTLHEPAHDSEKTVNGTNKAHLVEQETDDTASWRVHAASPMGVADAPGSTGDVPKRRYIRRPPISVTPNISKSDQNRIQLLAAVSAAVSPVKKRKKRSEQSYAHLRNRDNDSCHRCKNKKKFSVGCPFSKSHRYCKSCIERHCGLDWEDMCKNSKTVWKDGCPVCRNVCDCAACVKRAKGTRGDTSGNDSQLSVLSALATLDHPADTRKRRKTATWEFGQDANVVDNKSDSEPVHDSQDEADDEAGDDDYEGTHPHVVKKARVVADFQEEPLIEDAMDQEALLVAPTKPRGRGRGRGRGKGPRHSLKTEPVSSVRTRAASALLGDDATEEEGEERDLLESRGLRKKNGVYESLNDSSADAEAFLGLISGRAGSVLTRRYTTSNPSFERFIATDSAETED